MLTVQKAEEFQGQGIGLPPLLPVDRKELQGHRLGTELAGQGLLQGGPELGQVDRGDELKHQPMEPVGEGLVVAGTGDQMGEPAALGLQLTPQHLDLVLDQGDGPAGDMGDVQVGEDVGMALEELRMGPQIGGYRGLQTRLEGVHPFGRGLGPS